MNVAMLLEMAAMAGDGRVAVGPADGGATHAELLEHSRRVAGWIASTDAAHVCYLGGNGPDVVHLLFGSAVAGRPFVPLNYRLTRDQLRHLLERVAPAVVVTDDAMALPEIDVPGVTRVPLAAFRAAAAQTAVPDPVPEPDPDAVAVQIFTSGTTAAPKAATLRNRHLASYVLSSVELMTAAPDECALVSVPPYHIAGMIGLLTAVYAGRRIAPLPQFDAKAWVVHAREQRATHAMVVPTMLTRIIDVLEAEGETLPALRHLSYGGGRMPTPVIERALRLLPHVDFVNGYGLTETSSTIAVLGPQDHRDAIASSDPQVRARLASVGKPIPGVEIEVRDPAGRVVGPGERGEIHVRGPQVAGEYAGTSVLGPDGWFATKDAGHIDADGYLFLDGRLDDVIVRGGENVPPGEVEDVLVAPPAVAEAAVVGLPHVEWGETIVAAVVRKPDAQVSGEELREWVRGRLRSSRTPERVVFVDALPYTDSGKLLRRVLRAELAAG